MASCEFGQIAAEDPLRHPPVKVKVRSGAPVDPVFGLCRDVILTDESLAGDDLELQGCAVASLVPVQLSDRSA